MLARYNEILVKDGRIEFKTDNRGLFEYSLLNINKNKLNIEYISLNLHEDINLGKLDNEEPNIMTEYEKNFSEKGVPIKYLRATNL